MTQTAMNLWPTAEMPDGFSYFECHWRGEPIGKQGISANTKTLGARIKSHAKDGMRHVIAVPTFRTADKERQLLAQLQPWIIREMGREYIRIDPTSGRIILAHFTAMVYLTPNPRQWDRQLPTLRNALNEACANGAMQAWHAITGPYPWE